MFVGLGLEIGDVDVALFRVRHHHDAHPGHDRAGRIRAVRRRRDEHDVARRLAAIAVIGANHHQARVLPLRAGVRLQRDGRKAGDFTQRPLDLAKHVLVPLHLLHRHEGVRRRELGPRDRQHLGGRVELHRARAERDHRRVEPDVLPLEAPEVPHHLGLRVMRIEHGVRQERRRARKTGRVLDVEPPRRSIDRRGTLPCHARKHAHDGLHVVRVGRFVQSDVDRAIGAIAKIQPCGESGRPDAVAVRPFEMERVEERLVELTDAELSELALEQPRVRVHAPCDRGDPLGAVVDGIEAGDVREERLRRADVRRGLLAADVLLARLQRHAVRAVAVRVHRHADDPAGRLPHVLVERGEKRRVGTAVSHGHPEPLRVPQHDIGPQLAGRRHER